MLPRRVLGDADVGIADFARVYGSGHGHQQLRASESGQFAAVVQLGLVIVAMDTTESVPLVEAASVSVLPVNIDLNELHPRGTGEARSTLRGEPHLCPGLASSARRKVRQAGRRARHTRRWSVTSQVRTRPPALQPAMPPCCRQQEGRSGDQQGRPGQARDRRTRH